MDELFQNEIYSKLKEINLESEVFVDFFHHSKRNVTELGAIHVINQGKGHGSRVMDIIINMANDTGSDLILLPCALEGGILDDMGLIKWYERKGFVMIDNGYMKYTAIK